MTLADRIRQWVCRHFGHREYDDGNLIACKRCHVAVHARYRGEK